MSARDQVTLRRLQYAVAVEDVLSFRRAAELCGVSQPSLSSQLAELEEGLGVRLFERDRRRVLVTPAGAAILERARRILAEVDELVRVAETQRDPLFGSLRLGVIPTIAPYLLSWATPRLAEAYPQLTVEWIEDKTEALVRGVIGGELSGALLALEAELGELATTVVAPDRFVLAGARDHPLMQAKNPATSAELRGESVLLLDDGHCFRQQALEVCTAARARELELRATSLTTLVQMVTQGAGVTLLPEIALHVELQRSNLAIRRFDAPPRRTIALAWRKHSPLGPAFEALAAPLARACADAVGAAAATRASAQPRVTASQSTS
jgi:LysR family transcriptional regulator, hydrogen peroxide-inducible genes activator